MNETALQEFKQIILEDYGLSLTDEQTIADATAFLEAMKALSMGLLFKDSIDGQDRGCA